MASFFETPEGILDLAFRRLVQEGLLQPTTQQKDHYSVRTP